MSQRLNVEKNTTRTANYGRAHGLENKGKSSYPVIRQWSLLLRYKNTDKKYRKWIFINIKKCSCFKGHYQEWKTIT